MKILVLTPTFLPVVGGAELVVLEVYRRLALRHDVRLLTPVLPASLHREQGSSEYDALVTFPVEHYEDRVTLMRVRGHRWTAGALPPFSLSAVAAVRRAVAAARPDVLNVHYAMPTGLPASVTAATVSPAAGRWRAARAASTIARQVRNPSAGQVCENGQFFLASLVGCANNLTRMQYEPIMLSRLDFFMK